MEKKKPIKYGNFKITESDAKLVEGLPDYQRAILGETGSYEDIASRLKIAVGTAKSRMHRARAALTALREITL